MDFVKVFSAKHYLINHLISDPAAGPKTHKVLTEKGRFL